jgi:hypothetical protein
MAKPELCGYFALLPIREFRFDQLRPLGAFSQMHISARAPSPASTSGHSNPAGSVRHLALAHMLILIILDNGGNRLKAIVIAILDHVLQIEILNRNVVWAELEVTAH